MILAYMVMSGMVNGMLSALLAICMVVALHAILVQEPVPTVKASLWARARLRKYRVRRD